MLLLQYGSIIKKTRYTIQAVDRKSGEEVNAMRTRLDARSFRLDSFSEERVEMVMAKYWPDEFVDDVLYPPVVPYHEYVGERS